MHAKYHLTLTGDQLLLLLAAIRTDICERFARRHCFRRPIGNLPSSPEDTALMYAQLRELIATYRKLRRRFLDA